MTYELSREHEEFRRTVRDFAEAEIAPHIAQWDREHHFPTDVVQKMGALGLMGLTAPEEFGGAGLAGEDGGFTSLCLAIEEIGRVDQAMGITLEAAVGLGINPILTYGTDEQKKTWLPDLVAGQRLAGFGLTEPGAGSDAGATRTKAELVDGEWVVNGAKQFITNSGSAITSVVTVTARTGQRPDGRPEISTIMLPSGTPGFTAEKGYEKLGWHASDTHPLTFVDARVPESHLLGERGRGYAQFLATLDDGRVAIAALAVGCIQACLDLSLTYAGERQTFGGPIGRKQGVAFQISDLQVMLDASRLLTYRAASLKDRMDAVVVGGGSLSNAMVAEFKQAAAVAKLYATESAVTATRIATQVFGGYGFMEEYPVARFYRDAKVLEIGEGTSEVQRMLIARGLGLPVE
ncbi:acyl-CoA dehydrogenase family protein [Nocardioides jishulii]|uniref:Acyl-CoA dehydrogenase n=1 Tax=Nocardioides jishulii TaxID=2575440 RepID=A0A4U2YJ63_9ACTN|nr:acyl-CoA dehydrogenase family protein [Nocardioides jishulii]QCX28256.1 acyl-CoA dehydrogenase [Nocardioides jishulii]TKI60920.1 acyl-CoA dehydrogenase [Nocardioides jishulii]